MIAQQLKFGYIVVFCLPNMFNALGRDLWAHKNNKNNKKGVMGCNASVAPQKKEGVEPTCENEKALLHIISMPKPHVIYTPHVRNLQTSITIAELFHMWAVYMCKWVEINDPNVVKNENQM